MLLLGSSCHAGTPLILTGRVQAEEYDRLTVPVTSNWRAQLKWLIEEGSEVVAGEAVARLDPSELENRRLQAEQELISKSRELALLASTSSLSRLELELALLRAENEAKKAKLDAQVPQDILEGKDFRERQRKSMEAARKLEDARVALSTHEVVHEANRSQLEIEVDQLEDRVDRLQSEISSMTLRASRSGIVVHESHPWTGKRIRVGDQLQSTFPLARIPDMDTLQVEAWAAEADLERLEEGARVLLFFDAFESEGFEGKIVSVSRAAEKRAIWGHGPWFRVVISFECRDPRMKPGMSVRCEFVGDQP